MNVHDLIKLLEPLALEINSLRKQITELALREPQQGPPGPAPDLAEVLKMLVEKHGEQIKGDRGERGADADHELIFKRVLEAVLEPHNRELLKGEKGEPGDMPEIPMVELVERLAKTLTEYYPSILKGEKGDKGDTPEIPPIPTADDVAKCLATNYPDVIKGPKGEPGATPEIVIDDAAAALMESPDFIEMVRGEKGEPGKDADPVLVAHELASRNAVAFKGAPGKDSDPAEVAAILKSDALFRDSLRGEPGAPGENGEVGLPGIDGAGIEAPHWKAGIYREGRVVQHHIGRYYRALSDTNAEPGDSPEWERVGSAGFRFMGIKAAETVYDDGDVFVDAGSCFVVVNGEPRMLAKRGRDGKDGARGPQGSAGKDAPIPVHMEFKGEVFFLAMSDGSVLECDATYMAEASAEGHYRAFKAYREAEQEEVEKRGTPVGVFRGGWSALETYRKGDLVRKGNVIYLCAENAQPGNFTPSQWQNFGSQNPRSVAKPVPIVIEPESPAPTRKASHSFCANKTSTISFNFGNQPHRIVRGQFLASLEASKSPLMLSLGEISKEFILFDIAPAPKFAQEIAGEISLLLFKSKTLLEVKPFYVDSTQLIKPLRTQIAANLQNALTSIGLDCGNELHPFFELDLEWE